MSYVHFERIHLRDAFIIEMSRCAYPHCNFQVSHDAYLNLHMILEHSDLMPGSTQEMVRQLSTQIFTGSMEIVKVNLMKNIPATSYEKVYQLVLSNVSYLNNSSQ